jgi:hypothetical protein
MADEAQQEEILRAQREANRQRMKKAMEGLASVAPNAGAVSGDIGDMLRHLSTHHANAIMHLFASSIEAGVGLFGISKDMVNSLVGQYIIHKKYQKVKSVFREETDNLEKLHFKRGMLNDVKEVHKVYKNFKSNMNKISMQSKSAVSKLTVELEKKQDTMKQLRTELSSVEEKIKKAGDKVPDELLQKKKDLTEKITKLHDEIIKIRGSIKEYNNLAKMGNIYGGINFKRFVEFVNNRKLEPTLFSLNTRDQSIRDTIRNVFYSINDNKIKNITTSIIKIMNDPNRSYHMPVMDFTGTKTESIVDLSFKGIDFYNITSMETALNGIDKEIEKINHKIQSEIKYHPELKMDLEDGLLSNRVMKEAVSKDGVIQNKLIYIINDTFKKNGIRMMAVPVVKVVDGVARFSVALYYTGRGQCSETLLKKAKSIVGDIIDHYLNKAYNVTKENVTNYAKEKSKSNNIDKEIVISK